MDGDLLVVDDSIEMTFEAAEEQTLVPASIDFQAMMTRMRAGA